MKLSLHAVRKIILCITFLQMLILTQIASANASPATQVKVEPYQSTAQVGENFAINIRLTDVQNLFGVEVTLYWNASILQMVGADVQLGVESHTDGVLHEPVFIVKNETSQEEGKYWLAGISTVPADAFSGSGNIVRITFNVIGVGSCELNLETELANKPPPGGVSSAIPHTTIDGFFGSKAVEQEPIWPYVAISIAVIIVAAVTAIVMYRKRIKS